MRLREYTANYYNCMRRLDDGIALLLRELKASGQAENTFIIYIGDHGAQFSRGKGTVYEAGLRVPMIVHWPNSDLRAGQVRRELTSTLDIMPTLCDIAGLLLLSALQHHNANAIECPAGHACHSRRCL